MVNIDKTAISTPEEDEAFGAIVANRLIDTTPQQFSEVTSFKPKAVKTLTVELNTAQVADIGRHSLVTACEEVIKALNAGITKNELIETLQGIINANRESEGGNDGLSR